MAINLMTLKKQLKEELPVRTVNKTLLLATWNIRDFGSKKFNPRSRTKESLLYIAEIISAFDIVAVQEVNENLNQLGELMKILDEQWTYTCTDVTEGSEGNQERMAFIYDQSKVKFRNIAGEIVLPSSRLIGSEKQFARTPFIAAFQSGDFNFNLCTVHLYYGSESKEATTRRIEEIKAITKALSDKAKKEETNYILLGDFNIIAPKDETMKALLTNGFSVPDCIWEKPSTPFDLKYYDQIAFKAIEGKVRFSNKGGCFNYYNSVYRDDEIDFYITQFEKDFKKYSDLKNREKMEQYYLKKWRTWQMSDHLPMWIELEIDFSDSYLESVITENKE